MRVTGARRRRPSPYPRPDKAAGRNNRRRYIGGASALAIAGAVTVGFLGTGSAVAEGEADEVVFSGGCGLLANKSAPDKESVTTEQGKEITFVNELDDDAELQVGKTTYEVASGDSETVELSNSTEALMSPDCTTLVDKFDVATVEVEPASDEPDDGGSDGGGSGGDDGAGDGGDSDSDSGSGSGGGNSQPGEAPDAGANPDAGEDSAADGHAGDPNKESDKDSDKDEDKDQDQDKSESDDEAEIPAGGDAGADDSDSTTAGGVEPVNNTSSSSGLLAVLAAVCLLGVGVAAVRTALTSRANAAA